MVVFVILGNFDALERANGTRVPVALVAIGHRGIGLDDMAFDRGTTRLVLRNPSRADRSSLAVLRPCFASDPRLTTGGMASLLFQATRLDRSAAKRQLDIGYDCPVLHLVDQLAGVAICTVLAASWPQEGADPRLSPSPGAAVMKKRTLMLRQLLHEGVAVDA